MHNVGWGCAEILPCFLLPAAESKVLSLAPKRYTTVRYTVSVTASLFFFSFLMSVIKNVR